MANAKDQMKILDNELERVRGEIERLRVEEALLLKMIGKMTPGSEQEKPPRTRSPNVKPVLLAVMHQVGVKGATTTEADEMVRAIISTVAKDTVGSLLSRLKSDGALLYVGDRYYEKQFAPIDAFSAIRVVK